MMASYRMFENEKANTSVHNNQSIKYKLQIGMQVVYTLYLTGGLQSTFTLAAKYKQILWKFLRASNQLIKVKRNEI